jgi:hypothetical protein
MVGERSRMVALLARTGNTSPLRCSLRWISETKGDDISTGMGNEGKCVVLELLLLDDAALRNVRRG